MSTDTLAARLRAALVGDYTGDVMPFDELKPEIQERWQRVADAARVPFSDATIDKMAREASYSIGGWGYDNWDKGIMRNAWRDSVRRALAAVGPQYCPADVALQPTGHVLRDRLVEAERKVENQRMNLRELHKARERDAAKLAAVTAERADLRTQLARESEWVRQYKQNRDDALAELAAVKAERDDLQGKIENSLYNYCEDACAALGKEPFVDGTWLGQLKAVIKERDTLRSELAALRERAAVPVPQGVTSVVQPSSNTGQLPDDEVEALARVLYDECMEYKNIYDWDSNKENMRSYAHAAIAHMRKRPEGLPTAEELARGAFAAIRPTDTHWDYQPTNETRRWTAIAHHILAALAPYLREPVGWELDVNCAAVADWLDNHMGDDHFLNWFRSRIRPTFECKECAEMKQKLHYAAEAWRRVVCNEANDALAAALEGHGNG